MLIIVTICKLLLALGAGYFFSRQHIITPEVNRGISSIVMNLALPLLIVASVNGISDTDRATIIRYILTGIVIYLCFPLFAKLMVRIIRPAKEEWPLAEICIIFSNAVFMGYPIAASLYGNDCIFYITTFHLPFNLLYFTYGVKRIRSGDPKAARDSHSLLHSLLSPGTLASFLAILLFFFGISLPDGATEVMKFLGDLSTPLSMLVIGASISGQSIRKLFASRLNLLISIVRLIIVPTLTFFILTLLGFRGELRGAATITIGMPVASMIAMSCTQYQCHEERAASIVACSTLCAILTSPILLTILNHVG